MHHQNAWWPGGVASSPRPTCLATRSGWRRKLLTSVAGPPMQVQSSSHSVDASHERSAGNIKLGRAPFQNDQGPLLRHVAACSGPADEARQSAACPVIDGLETLRAAAERMWWQQT